MSVTYRTGDFGEQVRVEVERIGGFSEAWTWVEGTGVNRADDDTDETFEAKIMEQVHHHSQFIEEFWNNHLLAPKGKMYMGQYDPARRVVVGHRHYIAEDEGATGPFKGHGGRLFTWRMLDTGEVRSSRNLWSQGEIPERFWDRLPDNAEWVR